MDYINVHSKDYPRNNGAVIRVVVYTSLEQDVVAGKDIFSWGDTILVKEPGEDDFVNLGKGSGYYPLPYEVLETKLELWKKLKPII